MNKHIVLDGITYDLVERTQAATEDKTKKLSDISVGETFEVGGHTMIVLEQSGETTAAIKKDLLHERVRFGSRNNYDGSEADKKCCEFAKKIESAIGKENLLPHTVDLTSDDGLKDYGEVERKASLLTAELYRRYVLTLDKFNPEKWWWLSTPWSTPAHNDTALVKCVSPSGFIDYDFCNSDFGVRPFCILKSSIFVSV